MYTVNVLFENLGKEDSYQRFNLEGLDLELLKNDIFPLISKNCQAFNAYQIMDVKVSIEEDGEYFDSDEYQVEVTENGDVKLITESILEEEMEKLLIEKGYDIYDSERCIDSVTVADIAIDELGYKSIMDEDGKITFIKTEK